MKRLAAVFGSRHRSGHSDVASSQHDDASTANDDGQNDDTSRSKHAHLARPKSSFFRSLSRRAQPPAAPLITPQALDGGHLSSSSSSSAGPSTPDDDARSFVRSKNWLYQPNVAPPAQTAVHVQASLIVPQVEHESDDESSASEFSRSSARTPTVLSPRARSSQQPMSTPTPPAVPSKPLSAVEYARAVAHNGLAHTFSPPPLLHVPQSPLFPRSCNTHSQVASLASVSLRVQLFHKRVLTRLSQPSRADERALQPFTGRRQPRPRGPQLYLDDNAVSGRICLRSEGLRRWVDRPCFEDRLVVYRPAEEGEPCEPDMDGIVCVPVSGTVLGVAALEFSEHTENLAGLYDDLPEDTTFTADAETDAATEITFTLTASPTAELPKAKEIPASIEFPRKMSQDMHAAPALNVDVGVGGLGELIEFERKLSTDSLPPLPTPPLTRTPSSATPSPTSSGPPTPNGSVPSAPAASHAPDVKEAVKADAGARTPTSSPPQPSGILSSSQQRQHQYKATPSPLRIESNMRLPNPYSPTKPAATSGSSASSASPTPSASASVATVTLQATSSQPPAPKTTPRLAVRFADTTKGKDKDSDTSDSDASEDARAKRKESVPLGYVQRIKQQRLEKQRFLAAERARRAQAEEAQRRAAQARAQEEERLRIERRREEEERQRRKYQEELAAARARRESSKFVPPQLSMTGSATEVNIGAGAAAAAALAARGREREKAETYARPMYDQRRGSEASLPRSGVSRPRDGSRDPPPVPPLPISPSVRNASPASSGSGSGSHRDSSGYSYPAPPPPGSLAPNNRSSSAPDVRPRDRSASSSRGAGNRSSIADSIVGGRDRTSSNPSPNVTSPSQMWMANPMMGMSPNMNMNMNRMSMMGMPVMAVPMAVPIAVPVQGYPMAPMQMGMEPLLPPSPPFVMQQYGYRPPSQNSHRDSSPSSANRRSYHSSSTPPPPSRDHSRERSDSRGQSSSPSSARRQTDSFPPSSSGSAVRASYHYPFTPPSSSSSPAPPSPSRSQDHGHHRRSSAETDLHRKSNSPAPPVTTSRSERGDSGRKEREDRRSSKVPPVPSPSRSSRPQPYHASSMPSPAPPPSPPIVVERTSRSSSGFQILSRPNQQRRQTMIS